MSDAKCRARPPGQEKATVSRGPDTLRAFSTGAPGPARSAPPPQGSTAHSPGSLTGRARRPGAPTARRTEPRAQGQSLRRGRHLRKHRKAAKRIHCQMKPQTRAGAHACWLLKHVLEKLGLCFIGKDDTNGAKRERAAPAASPTGASQEEQLRTSLGARAATHQWPCGSSPSALPSS